MSLRRALAPGLVVAVAAAPLLAPEYPVVLLGYVGLNALVALGLVLLTGVGGVTSFGQAAFAGVGAYATAVWTTRLAGAGALGSPWVSLAAALALAAAVAFVLGFVTLRLSGHYLPLGTLAWAMSAYFLFGTAETLGGHTGLSGVPPVAVGPLRLETPRTMYALVWTALVAATFAARNLLDARAGRALRALRGGRVLAEAMGVDTARARRVLFTLAALLAALSGWLYAHFQRFVNPTPFSLHAGIEYLFMAVVGGVGSPWGALLGAGVVTLARSALQDVLPRLLGQPGELELVAFGVAMVVVMQRAPEGLWPWLARRVGGGPPAAGVGAGRADAAARADAAGLPRRVLPARGAEVLSVEAATKRFDGLTAVDGVSLGVKAGELVALIGPNGAGKSTLFDLVSGAQEPSGGRVRVAGRDVTGRPAREVAALGLARTFQHVKLAPGFTVLETAALGAHLRGRGGVLRAAARLERPEERRLRAEAARQLARVGLAAHADEPAASLPLGQQRLLEIARALAADPCLLLLDEPAAGLRHLEKAALATLLRELRAEGLGLLLVEHDAAFVMALADRVVVVDFGRKIAEGSPAEVQRDPRVLEAYLGVAPAHAGGGGAA